MKDNTAIIIRTYMNGLPEAVKKDVNWCDNENGFAEDTKAVLKAYRQMQYQNNLNNMTEDVVHQMTVLEVEKQKGHICEKDEEYIRKIVKDVVMELITENKLSKRTEDALVMAAVLQHIENLKLVPVNGHKYYHVVYQTFIANKHNLTTEELLQKIGMSRTHYYRLMNGAIEELSNIMWKN